jgi:hypothetical protein
MGDFIIICIVVAVAMNGTLQYVVNRLEDLQLWRDYERARKEFHAAIDRGELSRPAPVYISRRGGASVRISDIARTALFKQQLTALRKIRIAEAEKR